MRAFVWLTTYRQEREATSSVQPPNTETAPKESPQPFASATPPATPTPSASVTPIPTPAPSPASRPEADKLDEVNAKLDDINKQLKELKGVPAASLKRRLLELSREILKFLDERERTGPKYKAGEPYTPANLEKRSEYDQQTINLYVQRFASNVSALTAEAKKQGANTGALNFDAKYSRPVNTIELQMIASKLADLAGQL